MTSRGWSARLVAVVAVGAATLSLTGCSGDDAGAVGLQDASTALVAVAATGPIAEPGAAVADASRSASGFVIAREGLVVTTADVAAGVGEVSVRSGVDGEAVPAEVVGVSECLDLAVLRIGGDDDRPFLAWRRGATSVGIALHAGIVPDAPGTPPPMPEGTVSAIEEPLTESWVAVSRGLEHDVVLPANGSGAPLLDAEGRVAAIGHVADAAADAAADTADSDAGSAAVGSRFAQTAVEQIVAGEDVPSLGISGRAWTDAEGAVYGIWVRAVLPDGAAAAAGAQTGDVITSVGGHRVGADGTLSAYCSALDEADGEAVELEVYRPTTDEVLAGATEGAALVVVATGEVRRSGQFASISDASGLVRVDVPVEWSQVDGAGFTALGATWYSVVAAPNVDRFGTDRSSPGVQVTATGGGIGVSDLLAALSTPYQESCETIDVALPFDDGVYAGGYSRFSCQGTLAMVLSVRNARGANVAVVTQLASLTDQQQTLQRILSTFAVGR